MIFIIKIQKYRIFTFMNFIYILYIANNYKVDLVTQLLLFKLEVMVSIPKNNIQDNIQN